MAETRPYRALVIGCGRIAGGYDHDHLGDLPLSHAGGYTRHPAFELAACVDPDEVRRRKFAVHWGVPRAFATLDEAFVDGRGYDIVSVCSPTETHESYLEDLLRRPIKLVFCEKPLGADHARLERLVGDFERDGIGLCVNYSRRWDPALRSLKDDIGQPGVGIPRGAVAFYSNGLANNGSHLIDLTTTLLGALDVEWAGYTKDDPDADDPTVDAVLRTSDGVAVHICGTDARDYAMVEFRLMTSEGVIDLEQGGFRLRRRLAAPSPMFSGYRTLEGETFEEGGHARTMGAALDNIAGFLTSGEPLMSTGRSALATLALCDAIKERAEA